MTKEIFYLLLRQGQKRDKKLEIPLFLAYLLVPLVAGWSHFYLVLEASTLGLIISLAIGGAESIGGEVTVDFFRWS